MRPETPRLRLQKRPTGWKFLNYILHKRALLDEGLEGGSSRQGRRGGVVLVEICISLTEFSLLKDTRAKLLPRGPWLRSCLQ